MLCLAACLLFLVNFLISEHFFVMIVQVSPLLLLSVVCLQVEARPVKGNLLLPSVPSCHLLSCIPFFVIILLLPAVPLCFLFIRSSNPKKSQQSVKYREELGATWKWAHILVAQPGQIWGSKLIPKLSSKQSLPDRAQSTTFFSGTRSSAVLTIVWVHKQQL